ncbi:MAG TPA: hypothetical protein VNQ77_16675 [Frankiaceae bacterium]|nr:hypothetical protein [Frankiaceae bacterium]
MPSLPADIDQWLTTLHGIVPASVGSASPARIYARTALGAAAPKWFLLQVDPNGLHAAMPTVVNRLNVDGAAGDDLQVRVTPDIVAGPSGGSVEGAVIEVKAINAAQSLTGLRLDIGVRLDGPIVPPDGAADAQYVVLGIDAGAHPLPATITIVVAFESGGAAGTVGATSSTRVTLGTDTGGAVAVADHPLLLRVETHTGASRTQSAMTVVPMTPGGVVVDLPVTVPGLPGGQTTNVAVPVDIAVPDESGPRTAATKTRVELRRPGVRPHLAPPAALTWLSEIRAVEAGKPVTRDRIDWSAGYPVTLVLVTDDLVSARHTVVETSPLPLRLAFDSDSRRATRTVPHIQYDADVALDWLRLRDDQPNGTDDYRYLAVHALRVPVSLGLRLETAPGKPLRVVLSRHDSTEEPLPEPLGGAAALLGRHAAQLPPSPAGGLPQPLDLAEQTVAVDLDDVPVTHATVPPRLYVSLRAARYARVQQNTPGPFEEVHANKDSGLVVDLRLGPDERGRTKVLPHRALRLQMFQQVEPGPGETAPVHTRLLVRAGSLPDRTVVDLRTEKPATPGAAGYFGLRVWGRLRWVQALHLDRAAGPAAVDGTPMRLHVALPDAPRDGWIDVRRDDTGLFVKATEPVEAEVGMVKSDGLSPGSPLTRVVARVAIDESAELPAVPVGEMHVVGRGRGVSARVAVTGATLAPLAVRATPQVAMLQIPGATPVTEALTARVYGVTEVRQGGDPGFVPAADETVTRLFLALHDERVNKALRVRRRERKDATAPARDVQKVAIADLAEQLTVVSREGPPVGDDRSPLVVGLRRPSLTSLTLSRQTGRVVLWSEPEQIPYDGPRSSPPQAAGIGVTWLAIDALPRRLELAPLFDARYVPAAETRPENWPDIPADWTRDGVRVRTSDTLTIRDLLQGNWDRDKTDGSATVWSLAYIRELRLATDPVPDGSSLPTVWICNPSRRLDDSAFEEPESVLGVRVDGLLLTLDLDKYEQPGPGTPHWDDLPASWPLRAEVQFRDYGGQVSVGKILGTFDPTLGGGGPGEWWVRSVDGWLFFLGGGSAALGNTGGPPYHKDRIFS